MEANTQAQNPDLSESGLSKQRRSTWRRETRGLLLLYGVFVIVNAVIASFLAASPHAPTVIGK